MFLQSGCTLRSCNDIVFVNRTSSDNLSEPEKSLNNDQFQPSDNTNHRLITKLSTVYIFNSLIDSPFSLIMDFKTLNMIELTSNLQFKRIKFASKEHKRICFRFPFQTNKKRKPTSYMMRTTTIIDCETNKSHNLSNNE